MPFLTNAITTNIGNTTEYPFNIPVLANGLDMEFNSNVTFFVGENGSGKSTILEAIAIKCGFNPAGGNQNHTYDFYETESNLANFLRLSWRPKRITNGFFMRAESFFNFATYVDSNDLSDAYGGKSLHAQSHGEAFLSLFLNRFNRGIYLLDEPEAALSPQRQLAFMSIINSLENAGNAQFIIATHSPILLTYPGAVIFDFDKSPVRQIKYTETNHYQLTKSLLDDPELYFRNLFD
ncbi:AAA family ATPase [Dyadobacter psychrophilus]|uniref:Predicted ATPase n=1 Tax=Dyadobacter psychrophilus TaxID=651661 RepID=A0A1T5FGF3_9BACT|nr:AAA family ATPase [Dyadobacter psychrophilus]SKB95196.1 Predicted ATPase [Dyadobacter psychrophilus]